MTTKTYLHLFLRSIGFIHLINFCSILMQILPLIGQNGIAPLTLNLSRLHELSNGSYWIYFYIPSIYWWNASDSFLILSTSIGILASTCLTCSLFNSSRICLILCWMVLLSLNTSGGEFFAFPWDWLLLEATLLSFFLPSLKILQQMKPQNKIDPCLRFSFVWLIVRFYLGMGLEKLPWLNDNPYWTNYTYLKRFYETEQPMPTLLAYYAHHLPMWFHKVSCFGTFVFEIVSPLICCFYGRCGRSARNIGGIGMVLFQFPIMLTGNYSILNLLTIALCIPLFEFEEINKDAKKKADTCLIQTLPVGLRMLLLVHSLVGLLLLGRTVESLDYLSNTKWIMNKKLYATSFVSNYLHFPKESLVVLSAWKMCNGYGGVFHDSFAHEGKIVLLLEGSVDGVVWEPIQWKWHVHDVNQPPSLFAPYFPRLDHTVFYYVNNIGFNDLNPFSPFSNRGMADTWFVNFVQKLLQHESLVWNLLHPFKNYKDIQYIRADRALYRFTNTTVPATVSTTKLSTASTTTSATAWWKITHRESFLPPVCLHSKKECSVQNCYALCILHSAGDNELCTTFITNNNCQLEYLHHEHDPSSLLFINNEFLWHWINTLPISYLETLYKLYALTDESVDELYEKFSDRKLLRWGLNVLKQCENGRMKDAMHVEICNRLV